METIINKLVRNYIPSIIARTGTKVTFRALSNEDYKVEIRKKAIEEATELADATTREAIIEELVDLETVIEAVKDAYNISDEESRHVFLDKLGKKGHFRERYWLESIEAEESK